MFSKIKESIQIVKQCFCKDKHGITLEEGERIVNTITKIFKFEAAHQLSEYDGKCNLLHGHSYKLEIEIDADIKINSLSEKAPKGMICDFAKLNMYVKENIIEKLDHSHLNDTIDNPTAENLIDFIVYEFNTHCIQSPLVRVRLYETDTCYAEWRKE